MVKRWLLRRGTILVGISVVAFVGATLLAHALASRIDASSEALANDSSPSIACLASVRGQVRQVQLRVYEYVDARADGAHPSRRAIDESLEAVNADTRRYLELAPFPGEQPYWADVQEALAAFNRAVARTVTLADEGSAEKADAAVADDVRPAADRTITAAIAAIGFNAQNERTLALEIETARKQAILVSWSLTALAATFALVLALSARRVMRKQTELYEAQAQLSIRRIEELEIFAGRVAHDILNPVAAASMAIGLAQRTTSEERTRSYAERALSSLSRSRTLIDDLLQFTRAAAEPEPGARADLEKVVEETIADVVAALQPADLSFDVRVPSCACACRPGVLASIVSNLLRNAVKYGGGGPDPAVLVRALATRGTVLVEIDDNGPGLASGLDEDDVFRPLVRGAGTGQSGIGLGLATVKRLVEAHGGRVGCRSRPGEGCTFWFELPRAPAIDVEHGIDPFQDRGPSRTAEQMS